MAQKPFRSVKGVVQRIKFHPTRPLFFIAVRHTHTHTLPYSPQALSLHTDTDNGEGV